MGCLNSDENTFDHWFGNIHLSGPCNRSCYFCIGQHMMELDSLNNLDSWPLDGIHGFINECVQRDVSEVNVTGSNTEPLLYKHLYKLRNFLSGFIPNLTFGIRSNGALAVQRAGLWKLFDKGSLSITSFDPDLYKRTMGQGPVPNLDAILKIKDMPLKVNTVLCPETVHNGDVINTLDVCADHGIEKVNLREPYGQPHIGDPLENLMKPDGTRFGMPRYDYKGVDVTYWDVHYVHVESVNLYANGRVSLDYPVTRGHSENGDVQGQESFETSGRIRDQWQYTS